MRSAAAGAVAPPSRRLLAAELRQRLPARRLPRYSSLALQLTTLAYRGTLRELWRELAPDTPPATDLEELQGELVALVHHEHFPLDLEILDEMVGNGEGFPLQGPIMIEGQGVGEYYHDHNDHRDPVAPLRLLVDPEIHHRDRSRWWRERGHLDPATLAPTWLGAEHEPIIRALAELPAPLDALADLYQMIHRITGNAFLDTGPHDWDQWEFWYWCAADIRTLAEHFKAAQPAIARCDAYYHWFGIEPNAEARVIETLLALKLPKEPTPRPRTLVEVFTND